MLLARISIWAPLIYQYSVGGLLFMFSLWMIFRWRACDLRRRADRYWLAVLLVGMAAYFGVHLGVYLLAILVNPQGAGGGG